jgi:hypothetical protein
LSTRSSNQLPGFKKVQDQVPVIVTFDIHLSKTLDDRNEITGLGTLLKDHFTFVKPNRIAIFVDHNQFFLSQEFE